MEATDKRVIACNWTGPSKYASAGSLCYVLGVPGDNDRVWLLARSRGNRWIELWAATKRLHNFRFKTLPPEHPRYHDTRIFDAMTERDLERLQAADASHAGTR